MSSRETKKTSRPPGTKRARTREKLLSAATELFLSKGILAVSLDEVAAHAGLTKGAIYGNFESKDDLVCAVAAERGRRPHPLFSADRPLVDQLKTIVENAGAQTPAALKQLAFLTELDLYMLTHEGLKKRLFKFARERHRQSAEALAKVVRKGDLPLPPLEFAIVVHALFNGLLYQRAIWPEVVTDEVMLAALRALAR